MSGASTLVRFDDAVRQTPDVDGALRAGIQALSPSHRRQVRVKNARRLRGSIDVDKALSGSMPNAPRWDYGIGLSGSRDDRAVWVEFHPASSSHVDDILKKHAWLRGWLRDRAPLLSHLPREFKWVATGGVALRPGSPQRHRAAAAGIRFCGSHLAI